MLGRLGMQCSGALNHHKCRGGGRCGPCLFVPLRAAAGCCRWRRGRHDTTRHRGHGADLLCVQYKPAIWRSFALICSRFSCFSIFISSSFSFRSCDSEVQCARHCISLCEHTHTHTHSHKTHTNKQQQQKGRIPRRKLRHPDHHLSHKQKRTHTTRAEHPSIFSYFCFSFSTTTTTTTTSTARTPSPCAPCAAAAPASAYRSRGGRYC